MRHGLSVVLGLLVVLCVGGAAYLFLHHPGPLPAPVASAASGPSAEWWESANVSGVTLGMSETTIPLDVPEKAWQRLHDGYEVLEPDKNTILEIWTLYLSVVGVHGTELRHGIDVVASVGDPVTRLAVLGPPHWSKRLLSVDEGYEAWYHSGVILEAAVARTITGFYLVDQHCYRDITFKGGWEPPDF